MNTALRMMVALVALLTAGASQDSEPDPLATSRRDGRTDLRDRANKITESLAKMQPWEQHVGYMADAVRKVYERNGWTSDEDRFALDLSIEIESIPPERFQERFERLGEVVRERYNLDESQLSVLRGLMMRDAFAVFSKHSERVAEYASELLETRAEGQAVTPEKVARWVKLAQPVFEDARQRFEATAREFADELTPAQREIYDRDIKAAARRLERVDQLTGKWARGEWGPEDWGIEEDPIQLAGEAALRSGGAAAAPPHATAHARKETAVGDGSESVSGSGRREAATGAAPREDVEAGGVDRETSRPDAPGDAGVAPASERPRDDGKKPASAAEPDDEWARYVRDFIRRFKLDQAQQNGAWAAYRSLKEQADRARPRIDARIEQLQKQGGDAAERDSRIKAARKPVDDLFEQLKRRLDRIPTRKQRAEAEPSKPKTP